MNFVFGQNTREIFSQIKSKMKKCPSHLAIFVATSKSFYINFYETSGGY